MTKEEMYHHGILGQRWGVRRYQNANGTLTAAGRRRLGNSVSYDNNGRISSSDRARAQSQIHSNVANDYRNASTALQSASNAARSAASLTEKSKNLKREKAKAAIDTTKMSDADLQKAINRLNMERNYKSLMTENITSGHDYVSSILSTTGDVVAIASSAAMIAMAIHQIKS